MKQIHHVCKKALALLLALALTAGMIPVTEVAAEEEKPTKVVVTVEGQTLGQGFYIEPTIVTFDEFISYWEKKGQTVRPENITAGGVLSYALQQNGTPMDNRETPEGPAYMSAIKGVDKGYAKLPQFLVDAGITLSKTSDTPGSDLREKEYTNGAGWMYTEGNIMSEQAMGGHKFYSIGTPYTQGEDSYYVVRLQYSVAGLGADLGFDFNGTMPYSYKAADKGQLYILYAKLLESGTLEKLPEVREEALDVMNTLQATQEEVDAAYEMLLDASLAEKPVFTENLPEENIYYDLGQEADALKVNATVNQGSLTYEWFQSKDKKNWTSLGEAGADNNSYIPAVNETGTVYYKCIVTNYDDATGFSNTVESNIATVISGIATPVFEMDLDTAEKNYLITDTADTLKIAAITSDGGILSYQWYESADKENWNEISGMTADSFTPDVSVIGTTYYKCIVTNSRGESYSSAESKIAKITAKADMPFFTKNLRTTTYSPAFDEECVLSVETTVRDGGEVTYQWYTTSNPNETDISKMTPIEGAAQNSYAVDTSKPFENYYKVAATNTVQGQTVTAISNWSRVEVKVKRPYIDQDLEREVRYLVGEESPEALTIEASAEDDGELSYQWYESAEEPWSIREMTPIEGAAQKSYAVDTSTGYTKYYACRVTNTNRGQADSTDSRICMVVVSCQQPILTKDLPDTVTYLAGEEHPVPLVVEASVEDGGTLTYQWYQTDGYAWSIEGMEAIEGATEASYTPDISKDGMTYACRITNTKDGYTSYIDSNFTEVEITCAAPEFTKDLDTAIVQYQKGDKAETLRVEAAVSDGGEVSYQWYCGEDANAMNAIEGANAPSYTPSTEAAGTLCYQVAAINTKAGITNETKSAVAKITVLAPQEYISTEEELRAMNPNGNYVLTEDIELTAPWKPIEKFSGILDGNGHVISGVEIEDNHYSAVAFFNTTGTGASIKNLGLEGKVTQTGWSVTAGLVGMTKGDGLTISNCYVNAEVKGSEYGHVGGLAGKIDHQAVIENSYFTGTLSGGTSYAYAGGLAAQIYNYDVVIRNSYTTHDIAVGNYARYNETATKNNYCASEKDEHAAEIPEDMDAFLTALNAGGKAFSKDKWDINRGYPVQTWIAQRKEEEADAKKRLDRAEAYLTANVTNPVVDTICGEWSVIAMARYGVLPEQTKKNYLANLYQKLDEEHGILSENSYTEYSRVVLALTALGIYPGEVNGYNLLYPLADFENVIWQGINGPIFALLALDSHNYEIPELTEEDLEKGMVQTTRQKLIDEILAQQLADNGWALAGMLADPDMTAMAIQALTPYYGEQEAVTESVDKALERLSQIQDSQGGFSSWGVGNVESSAQTIIALSGLDVNLLSDQRFVKNGKSVLDNLLTYQLADGSFIHMSNQSDTDPLSTDQGTLALLAYFREVNGQNALYDMTDVSIDMGEEKEATENIEKFRAKLNALPKNVFIKDQQQVYALLSELDQMKQFEEKEAFRAALQGKRSEIEAQKKEVEALDQDIWNLIDPLHITKEDADVIQKLMDRYSRIPDANKEYVKNRADLLLADAVVKKLMEEGKEEQKPSVPQTPPKIPAKQPAKKPVQNSQKSGQQKEQDKNLRMEGKMSDGTDYTFTILEEDKEEAKNINIGLSRKSPYEDQIRRLAKNPAILHFEQEGDFPGPVQVEVTVDKEDGEYLLLYYNPDEQKAEFIQKVVVKDKKTKFIIEKGGSYFIDKKASAKSLKEASDQKEQEIKIEETAAQETKDIASQMPYAIAGICVIAVLVLGIAYARILKKRKDMKRKVEKDEA